VNGCVVYYSHAANALWLLNNAGTAWLGPITLGLPGTLQNSQCTVGGQGSSSLEAGNYLVLYLPLTFSPAFAGWKWIYLDAFDGTVDSGFSEAGYWDVGQPLPTIAVTPNVGSGLSQTFSFQYPSSIVSSQIVFESISASSFASSCYVYYNYPSQAYG
jgi:hypothetical protein